MGALCCAKMILQQTGSTKLVPVKNGVHQKRRISARAEKRGAARHDQASMATNLSTNLSIELFEEPRRPQAATATDHRQVKLLMGGLRSLMLHL